MGSKIPITRQEPLPRAADIGELMGLLKLCRGGQKGAAWFALCRETNPGKCECWETEQGLRGCSARDVP